MTDLSLAAQTVLDAANKVSFYGPDDCLNESRWIAAAALRAAADQVVPEQSEPPCGESEPWPQSYQLMADSKWEQRQKTRAELLAIAAELKKQMTNQHPITPPPELSDEQVGEWLIDDGYPWDPSEQAVITITTNRLKNVACQAFQAGADQELEACCEWLHWQNLATHPELIPSLRAARRPKPPSLKEQALEILQRLSKDGFPCNYQEDSDWDTIRRALDQLPDS